MLRAIRRCPGSASSRLRTIHRAFASSPMAQCGILRSTTLAQSRMAMVPALVAQRLPTLGLAERIAPRAMAIHSGSSTAEVQTSAMPSFGGGSLPQHATSFLFPKMTEAQFLWPGVQGNGSELDVQPGAPVPGFNVKPPTDDPPGFRIATDGSIRDDVAFVSPGYAVGLSPPPRVGFAVEDRPLGNNPFNFLDRQAPNVGPRPYALPSPQSSPIYPWTTEMPPLERELQGYLDNLGGSRDTPPAAGDTGLRTDDAAAWRELSDTFGLRSFEYNRRDEKPPLTGEPTRQIEGEN